MTDYEAKLDHVARTLDRVAEMRRAANSLLDLDDPLTGALEKFPPEMRALWLAQAN